MAASNRVLPYRPLKEERLRLTIGDAYGPKLWAKQVYFYPLKDSTTGEKCAQALRDGLSRVLTDMPRVAGELKRGDSGHPCDLFVEINKNAHAIFDYQDWSNDASAPTYAELKSKGFPLEFEFSLKLLPDTALRSVVEGDIQLQARLTKVKGGLCLASAHNHAIGDAGALSVFETIWAMHTADVSSGRPFKRHWVDNDPKMTEWLSTPKEGAAECDIEIMTTLPATAIALMQETPSETEAREAQRQARAEAAEDPDDEFKWGIYYFSGESIRRLRKAASRSDAPQPISRAAALGALFWTRRSYISKMSEDGEEDSQLFFPINVRHRLDPPVHQMHIGNVVDIVPSTLDLSVLERNDSEALVTAASTISQSVHDWSQPRWESWLNAAALLPPDQALCPNPLIALAQQNLVFNDYSRTITNIVDWGKDVGVIERMRYPRPATGPSMGIRVHPGLPDGGVEVAVTGNGAILTGLAKDEVFSKYAKLVCYPA